MIRRTSAVSLAATLLALAAGAARAAPLTPMSYTMLDGSYAPPATFYRDESYSGDRAFVDAGADPADPEDDLYRLSGGLGDLVDGVVATENWIVVEPPAGPGPYVGWLGLDPIEILFEFGALFSFDSITLHFDDSNGLGGVTPPTGVSVNGLAFGVDDPADGAPFAFTAPLGGLTASTLALSIDNAGWTFLSEAQFDGVSATQQPSAVPLPGALPMLLTGAAAIALARRCAT